ncbi:hypothetical protein [Aliiroseovarius crassostreae]|nr:hypothetical protein [Aliiroseovarius crassostreae]
MAFLPPISASPWGAWLGETAGPAAFVALALVAIGIILINRH